MELANVQSCLEVLDPKVEGMQEAIKDLDEIKNKMLGSLRALVWMNGVMMAVLIMILGVVLTWGLNHITIRTQFIPGGVISSETSPMQDTGLPPSYQPK